MGMAKRQTGDRPKNRIVEDNFEVVVVSVQEQVQQQDERTIVAESAAP